LKQFANGIVVAFVALQLFAPGISGIGGEEDHARAYIREYAGNLATLKSFADVVENSSRSQVALAQEWAELSTQARSEASQLIDEHVAAMLKDGADRQQIAEFIRHSCETWKRIGEAL